MMKVGSCVLLLLSLTACGSTGNMLDAGGNAGWGGSAGDIQAEAGSGAAVAGSSADPGGRPGFAGDTGLGGSAGSGAGSAGQGESGSAGEGGEAGMGPAVCAIVAARYCDDGNDCTEDICDATAGCLHPTTVDGTACDDHDACTREDACLAGVCTGQAAHGQAQAVSELDAFGGYDESASASDTPQGLSAVLSENMLVFAEFAEPGMSLKLVRVDPTGLTLLDRTPTYSALDWEPAGLWSSSLGTHLVALSGARVALVTSKFDIEIYDVVGGKLELKSYRYLSQDALDISVILGAAAGPGNTGGAQRLWLMGSTSLSAYDIAASAALTPVTTFSASKALSAMATSDDGNTLYVGGQFGLETIDVTDPLHPAFGAGSVASEVTEHRPYQITVHGGYLLLQDELLYDSPGDLRLMRTSDFAEVARFPASSLLDTSYSAPTGAAFVDGGFVLQRLGFETNQSAQLSVELYTLDSSGPVLQSQWVFEHVASSDGAQRWQPYPPSASGRLALLGPSRRVVWAEGGTLTELKGQQQGTFEKVVGGAGNRLLAYGTESTHVLDISKPDLPTVLAGGLLDPGVTHPTRFSVSTSPSKSEQLNVENNCWWPSGTGKITQFADSGNARVAPRPVGELTIACGAAQTALAGLVYRVSPSADGRWQLDTFELPTTPVSAFSPAPIESVLLAGSLTAPAQPTVQIAADPVAHDLLIALQGDGVGATASLTLDWFSRDSGRWELVGTVQVPKSDPSDRSVVVQGSRAVIVSPNWGGQAYPPRIDVIRHEGAQIQVAKTWSPDLADVGALFPKAALGISGPNVYVVMEQKDPTIAVYRTFVNALSLDSLDTVACYPVSEVPRSMATVNGQLFFGAHSMIASATPQCL